MSVRLSPRDQIVFRDLLFEAFVDDSRFAEFLAFRLNRKFAAFHRMNDTYPDAIRRVVTQFNAEVRWRELLREARNAVPDDPGLVAFGARFEQAPLAVGGSKQSGVQTLSPRQLELRIKADSSMGDIVTFRRRLGEIEGRVCRVEFPAGRAWGTGFLVGPDVVITNYHVIQKVLEGKVQAAKVVLRFDYKVLANGVAVSAGKEYRLATDWLIDSSPYSPRDSEVNPQSDPGPDELDYALLRVEGEPAADPVGGDTADPSPVPRYWIPAPTSRHDFGASKALFIVQHPDGKPMQVALDSDAVIGINGNGTRVRYTTFTEPGSSGSPCFSANWDWVALHHSGDPKYYKLKTPAEFNQGIPLTAILERLNSLGKADVLGGGD